MDSQRSDQLKGYRVEIDFALDVGEGPLLRACRERIAGLSLTPAEQRELEELDSIVIEEIIQRSHVADYLLKDDLSHPLDSWWWHFGKLRAGSYPVERLPVYLQEIYEQQEIIEKVETT
jgi:hypothetical protein